MSATHGDTRRTGFPVTHALACLAGVWVLLALGFLIPILDPGVQPNLDLAGWPARVAYQVTRSAGPLGSTLVAAAVTLVILTCGVSDRRLRAEAPAVVLALGLFLGGGAWLNEHVVKPWIGAYRPNIVEVATAGEEELGSVLSAAEIYSLPDDGSRSEYIRSLTTETGIDGVQMAPSIREHWIDETGFAFPSGHTFAAMLIAAFALAMGAGRFRGWRVSVPYGLLAWAVMVGHSRTLLRVHSPLDVLVGGIEGSIIGLGIAVIVRWVTVRA